MRWLITGGCGFIGRNFVASLLGEAPGDNRLLIVDNLSAGTIADLETVPGIARVNQLADRADHWVSAPAEVNVHVGDIRDAALMERLTAGADAVLHFAANTGVQPSIDDPRLDCETNVVGTLNVLEACRKSGVKRMVFASSGAPAGDCTPPIHEEMPHRPISPYGASKMAGEGYCRAYAWSFGLEPVVLRFSNVYGPYSERKGSVVATFIRGAIRGQSVPIYGDGDQTRDFLFVEDLVEAVRLAATSPGVGGEVFQIGSGVETSVNELMRLVNDRLASAGLPAIQTTEAARRAGDMIRNYTDPSKAERVLGWTARQTLPEGLDRTLAWFVAAWDGGQPRT